MNNLQIRLVKFASLTYDCINPFLSDKFLESVVKQIIKSSTSVGANYSEAQSSSSYRDFHNKIKIAQKELHETIYWILYLRSIKPNKFKSEIILNEMEELMKIFTTISKKTDLKLKTKDLRPKLSKDQSLGS